VSPRKLIVLSLVVAGLFAFIVLFERRLPSTEERRREGEKHWELPQDRVESIRLERGGETVELVKQGPSWKMAKPDSWDADTFAASDLARTLAHLPRAGGEPQVGPPEEYGLKPPMATATFVWTEKDGGQKFSRTLELGTDIPGTDLTAARQAGDDRILFVPRSVSTAVRKSVDELKSREVFGMTASDIVKIGVERGRGRLDLERRAGVWWLAQPLSDLADADAAAGLAADLSGLRVIDFVPPGQSGDLATLGLAPPLFVVTVADGKDAARILEIGATRSDGASVYARRSGQVFTLDSDVVEDVSREAETYRSVRLFSFDRNQPTAISGSFPGGRRFDFVQKDGGWSSGGRPLLAPSVDDLLGAVLDIESRTFLDSAEAVRLAGGDPTATVTVTLPAREPWTARFYARQTGPEAIVQGRPGAFRVAADTVSRLEEAFRKAAASPTPAPPSTAAKTTPPAAATPKP
jgi:hypothetical protein